MKNKKLYAILTLVAFMITLMPIMAFAATAPQLTGVTLQGSTHIQLVFDQPLDKVRSAANETNFTFTNDVTAKAIAADIAGQTITVELKSALNGTTVKDLKITYVPTVTNTVVGTTGEKLAGFTADVPYTAAAMDDIANVKIATAASSTINVPVTGLVGRLSVNVTSFNDGGGSNPAALGDLTVDTVGGNTIKIDVAVGKTLDPEDTYTVSAIATGDLGETVTKTFTVTGIGAGSAPSGIDYQASYVYTVKNNPTVTVAEDTKVTFELNKVAGGALAGSGEVYVWAQEKDSNVPSTAFNVVNGIPNYVVTGGAAIAGVEMVTVTNGAEIVVNFSRAGEYTIFASLDAPKNAAGDSIVTSMGKLSQKLTTITTNRVITVDSSAVSRDDYQMLPTYITNIFTKDGATTGVDAGKDGSVLGTLKLEANNVAKETVKLKLVDNKGIALKQKEVKVTTNSGNVEVSSEKVSTNMLGYVEFDVTGIREGSYKIFVNVANYEATILVQVGSTSAAYIELNTQPAAPVDLGSQLSNGADDVKLKFNLTDINGNAINGLDGTVLGWMGAKNSDKTSTPAGTEGVSGDLTGYVSFTQKPAKSKLENKDLTLIAGTKAQGQGIFFVESGKAFDAEGLYEIKVVLDNGKTAYGKVEVKEFQTPVSLRLVYNQEAIELGGQATIEQLVYVDANGVTKAAKATELAATGYAIDDFVRSGAARGQVTVKTDERYVGSVIKVTAIDSRYNLVANAELKVADEAQDIEIADKVITINENNRVDFQIVDANGNKVSLDRTTNAVDINYVVLSKPEGSKVSVHTASQTALIKKGQATMAITADTKGQVEVQVLVRAVRTADSSTVTKYYTGTKTFNVGSEADKTLVDKAVKMVLGEKVFVVDGKMVVGEVAPFAQDNRTYIPVRSFEALGFDVEWNESEPNLVTLTADDTVVVMEIGSNIITINGEATTMDVPALVKDYRTFLPIRFAAEAIGYEFDNAASLNGDIIMTKVK